VNPSPFMDLAYFVSSLSRSLKGKASVSFQPAHTLHVALSTLRVLSTQNGNEDAVFISCLSENRIFSFDLGFVVMHWQARFPCLGIPSVVLHIYSLPLTQTLCLFFSSKKIYSSLQSLHIKEPRASSPYCFILSLRAVESTPVPLQGRSKGIVLHFLVTTGIDISISAFISPCSIPSSIVCGNTVDEES
jgi:hypothetical protein